MDKAFRERLVRRSLEELLRVLEASDNEALRLQAAQTALRYFSEEAKGASGGDGLAMLRALLLEDSDGGDREAGGG